MFFPFAPQFAKISVSFAVELLPLNCLKLCCLRVGGADNGDRSHMAIIPN